LNNTHIDYSNKPDINNLISIISQEKILGETRKENDNLKNSIVELNVSNELYKQKLERVYKKAKKFKYKSQTERSKRKELLVSKNINENNYQQNKEKFNKIIRDLEMKAKTERKKRLYAEKKKLSESIDNSHQSIEIIPQPIEQKRYNIDDILKQPTKKLVEYYLLMFRELKGREDFDIKSIKPN